MQTASLLALASNVDLESLTISADALPHHYVARAVILDLQPASLVAAIVATMDRIKAWFPYATRTGWRATSDSLTIYFHEWRPSASAQGVADARVERRVA